MRPLTDQEIKRSIANVKATFAVEGLEINKRSVVYGKKYMKGEITSEEAVESLKKYLRRNMSKK